MEPIKTGWYFDRGIEVLLFLELREDNQGNIVAWSRPVWEAAGFNLAGLRAIPSAPPPVHQALLKDPSRWR
jgi:hypothetical protein